jgi:fructokinase
MIVREDACSTMNPDDSPPLPLPPMSLSPLLGVDLGGTKTEVIVLDAQGRTLYRARHATQSHDYPALLQGLMSAVDQARAELGLDASLPVGMGIPGCLDPRTHTVRGANTQCLNGQPLLADLRRLSACDWRIENDANCLVLSEATDGAAAGAGLVFGVILGTGCGGGWSWQGQVWTGPHGLAGEWGHNPLPWPSAEELQTPACWCGQVGCLETWLSGTGAARQLARETGLALSMPEWLSLVHQGHAVAQAAWARYVSRLARALAAVINQNDPEVIVLGGGVSLIDEIYTQVPQVWSQWGFHRPLATPLRKAQYGDASGVRGAAWLWRSATQSAARTTSNESSHE